MEKRKNWYELNNIFTYIVNFSDKQITLWSNKKNGGTKYQLLIWKDNDEVCFKFGKTYGLGSCWETIFPNNKFKNQQMK